MRRRLAEDVGRRSAPRRRGRGGRRRRRRSPRRDRATDGSRSGRRSRRASRGSGPKTMRNCGTPKSNSTGKTMRPIKRPPASATRRGPQDPGIGAAAVDRAWRDPPRPSGSRSRSSVIDGAADEHEVRRAPEGDVLAEDAMPDVVERKADQGEHAARGHDDTAERRVPVADDANSAPRWLFEREDAGEEACGEDAEEPAEDQIVGGVGEGSLVAACVDVDRYVPEEAEEREEQRTCGDCRGEGRPAGEAACLLREARPGDRARAPCRSGGRVRGRGGRRSGSLLRPWR